MSLLPIQLNKLIALTGLIAMFSGCADAPVQQASLSQTTLNKATGAATPPTPLNPEVEKSFNQGLQAIKNKDYDKAIEIFYALSRNYPDLSGPYANLGMLLLDKKDYTNAEIALKQALHLNPANPEIYNYLGLLYRQNGRFDDALQIYRQGLEQSPKNIHLLRNTGILLELYINTPAVALEYYQRYLEQQPDDK